MLKEMKVEEFLRELASPSPAPGDSAIAALSTALAAGLLSRYCNLSQDREVIGPFTDRLREIGEESRFLLGRLMETFDEDTVALNLAGTADRAAENSAEQNPGRDDQAVEAETYLLNNILQAARGSLRLLSLVSETGAGGNSGAINDLYASNLQAMAGLRGSCYKLNALMEREQSTERVLAMADEVRAICSEGEILFKANREMIEKNWG